MSSGAVMRIRATSPIEEGAVMPLHFQAMDGLQTTVTRAVVIIDPGHGYCAALVSPGTGPGAGVGVFGPPLDG